jgi:adenylyltransferase/sulfurtransferase
VLMQPLVNTQADLTNEEIRRYSRHVIMPEVGIEGQRKLKASSVLLIGTGGLGSPLALYLTAAGIGHIGLVDYDVVDASNLQRQIIHGQDTIGVSKLDSAEARALRCHHRRHRQFPHALPGQRRLRQAGQTQRVRQRVPL